MPNATARTNLLIAGATLPPAQRLARAASMNQAADALALAGLRRRLPNADSHQLGVALALQRIGQLRNTGLADRFLAETAMTDAPADFLRVAARAATICTDLTIPYLIGGGIASTVHGEFRTTRDIDLIVWLRRDAVTQFASALSTSFVLHPPDVAAALLQTVSNANSRAQRGSFAAYDRETGYRLDVIVTGDTLFDQSQRDRAIPIEISGLGAILMIASAEDTVLTKLEWYAITPSDRQWSDVQSIVQAQGDGLDHAYITHWAVQLGIAELWAAGSRGEAAPHLSGTREPPPSDDAQQLKLDLS